jgi:hypothetical protein
LKGREWLADYRLLFPPFAFSLRADEIQYPCLRKYAFAISKYTP